MYNSAFIVPKFLVLGSPAVINVHFGYNIILDLLMNLSIRFLKVLGFMVTSLLDLH